MKLSSLSKYIVIFTYLFFFFFQVSAEDSVDIWEKNKKIDGKKKIIVNSGTEKNNQNKILNNVPNVRSSIVESLNSSQEEAKLYGIYDPEKNNLDLNMWINTDGKEIKNVFKRINKIKLSNSAEELFLNTIMTYSYSSSTNMTEEEFLELKIRWLIQNNKDFLLEELLSRNKDFSGKKKIIQYLVDKSIAKANLNEACKKTNFINKEIIDSYLEKFKIYCLIFNDKKTNAQLLFEILNEQGLSDNFFNSKINFLLGIKDKADTKIKDDNLLNFYLSSITVPDFNYEPTDKTNKFIWEYLNAANLIRIDDMEDKEKIKSLEIAANNNTLDKLKIFEIYKKIPFDINQLVNAEGIFQSLEGIDSRALIYQKYLLADNVENKIKLLFLLKDQFKKENISNVYKEFMSSELESLMKNDIPNSYREAVEKNIISKQEYKLGKIKYDDKVLHRSRVLRFYTEPGTQKQKSQKDLNNIYKKIKRNKNYFFSAKDLALIETLLADGFSIPKDINYVEISKKYPVPKNLINLIKNKEIGLLSLKFVEIIGEDEISNLDPETVYFIINILNQAELINFRNKIIATALPLRE
jgi:hypothetical protein